LTREVIRVPEVSVEVVQVVAIMLLPEILTPVVAEAVGLGGMPETRERAEPVAPVL
jgi:hypothetical protein